LEREKRARAGEFLVVCCVDSYDVPTVGHVSHTSILFFRILTFIIVTMRALTTVKATEEETDSLHGTIVHTMDMDLDTTV
jgi:hypothetical protein